MGAEHVPGAGGEPVIDATLAARLLRPLVRPGVSDPAHGPSLAARLQRMTAPSLADDVARRYGSATLGGDRPPVVYAAPPAPPGLPADSSASSVPHPAPGEPTRPVVRASERATGPVFPPVRPLGAGPAVQRLADPAPPAAALPVVVSRRPAPEPPGGAAGTPSRPDARAVPGSPRPVVAPSPTRLQRQLAAERAEAAPETAPAVQRVRAQRSAPGGGGSRAGAAPAAGAGSPPPRPVAGLEEPRSSSPVASRGDAGAGAQPAASGAVVVQRTAVPGTAGEAPSTGAGSTGSPPVAQAQSRTPGAAGPVQRRVVPGAAGGAPGGGGSGDGSPAPGGGTRGAAGWVQRAPAPDGTAGPPAAGNGSPGSSPVAGAGTAGRAGPVQRAAAPQARDAAPVAGGGSGGGLPVVEARAGGSGGMVQRGPLRVVGDAPATGGESAGSHPLTRARAPGAPGPVQRASVRGAAGEVPPAAGGSVVRHRVVAHPAGTMGPVQRAAVPGAAGEVGSTGHGSAGHPVVEARAPGATRPVQRARLLGPAGDVLVLAGGRGPASRVRGEDAATVQRTSLPGPRGPAPGGADFPLAHAARPVASAGSEEPVQRIAATSAPPQGAPSAELPTVAAPGARPSGGGDTARLAEQVYEILVRRLENERKQRGW